MLDGRFVLTHPIKFEKNPGIYETDIKMLNCIPRYESTKGQAEGSGFKEQTTDTSMHQCTIAKMYQCTNELFQGIINQILKKVSKYMKCDDRILSR